MCTAIIRIDPDAAWPLLVAFVRDEDRRRPTDPPAAWWPHAPSVVGGRDRRAGGTWLALDRTDGRVAMLLNRFEPALPPPVANPRASRGALPIAALAQGARFDPERDADETLRDLPPFHLVTAHAAASANEAIDWWQWGGIEHGMTHRCLEPGLHVVASRGIDLPGEPERRAHLLECGAAAHPPPLLDPSADARDAWGDWIDLLDGRAAAPGHYDGAVLHSAPNHPDFGTVGASLMAISRAGTVRYDVNSTRDLDPDAWRRVDVHGDALQS